MKKPYQPSILLYVPEEDDPHNILNEFEGCGAVFVANDAADGEPPSWRLLERDSWGDARALALIWDSAHRPSCVDYCARLLNVDRRRFDRLTLPHCFGMYTSGDAQHVGRLMVAQFGGKLEEKASNDA